MLQLKLKKAFYLLSLFFICSLHITHAAAIKENHNAKAIEKSPSLSLVEKALDQQKRNTSMLPSTNDELKMLNTLHATPTQNFFASQHERFSRFVQSIFQSRSS